MKGNETKRTKKLPKVAKNVAGNGQKIINLWVGFMENGIAWYGMVCHSMAWHGIYQLWAFLDEHCEVR